MTPVVIATWLAFKKKTNLPEVSLDIVIFEHGSNELTKIIDQYHPILYATGIV